MKRSVHMEGKCFFILLLALLAIHSTRQESLCNKPSRPPPAGCCPKRYVRQCCPIAGENETVYTCLSKSLSRSGSSTGSGGANVPNAITRPTFGFDYRTDCVHSWRTQACAGGFYLNITNGKPEACPKGFFCPANLLCVIPCPSGAYCISKKKQMESSVVKCKGFGVCCGNNDPPLILNISKGRKCKGVDDTNCICGGRARPLPCPGGYYCPTPDVKLPCDSGQYCRPGSTEPLRCPGLTRCKKLSSAPITNFIAPLINTIVLLIFIVSLLIQKYWRTIRKYCPDVCCAKHYSRQSDEEEGPVYNKSQEKSLKKKSFPIDIKFENLGLTLKSGETKGNVVLQEMTGFIRSNEVTAVMGPSGSGKTTFLNAVSGKAYYGKRTGKILINDKEVSGIKRYRSITGFVPQEDTMHRNLTAREVLYYQAKLRLPANTSAASIDEMITQTLEILEISDVADSVIGDETKKGISGGQRKRVNIGMELIADPTLLFLDEPTSGLDSTSSLSILKCLRKLAEKGLTVVCVIHQPRSEIFKMFHNILLLGCDKNMKNGNKNKDKNKGVGKIVYQGEVDGAKQYFKNLGFQPEPDVNPADYYMDVIGGLKKPAEGYEEKNLFEEWKKKEQKEDNAQQEYNAQEETRVQPGPIHQFITFTKREFKLQARFVKTLAVDVFLVFFAGGVLGALYLEVTLGKFTALTRMSGMAIGLTAILSSLRCFGNHRTTFWRESAAGVNRVSYFFAVNFAQIPILVMMPLVYLSLLYTWTSPRSYFSSHYAAVFCAQLCCSGIGYAISTIFNPKSSQMASVVVVLVMAMLSGSSPTLCKMDEMTFFGPLGYNLSFIRWFVEALFEKEALRYPNVHRPQRDGLAFQDHYTLDGNYSFCLGVLVIMAVVYRLIALVFLLFTNRGKQQ